VEEGCVLKSVPRMKSGCSVQNAQCGDSVQGE